MPNLRVVFTFTNEPDPGNWIQMFRNVAFKSSSSSSSAAVYRLYLVTTGHIASEGSGLEVPITRPLPRASWKCQQATNFYKVRPRLWNHSFDLNHKMKLHCSEPGAFSKWSDCGGHAIQHHMQGFQTNSQCANVLLLIAIFILIN